jgi:hypothetical protein
LQGVLPLWEDSLGSISAVPGQVGEVRMDFRFRSFNVGDHFIRHRNFLGELTRENELPVDDFAFNFVKRGQGLIAFRSRNFPDRRLRHRDFRIHLEGPNDPNPQLFIADSTFQVVKGLADPNGFSFKATNLPNHFIRHRDFHLFVEPQDSPNLAADATFFRETAPVLID